MAGKIHFELVTPYGMFMDYAEAEMVVLPAYDGQIAVQKGHVPLIVSIIPGLSRIHVGGEILNCFVSHGYAVIEPELVTLIVSAAEWPENIDIARAEASIKRAEEKLKDRANLSDNKISSAEHAIRRSKARIHIAEKYKNKEK